MTAHKDPDPEGDKADEVPFRSLEACPACRGPLDSNGDCIDENCPECPDYLSEDEIDDNDELEDEEDDEPDAKH